MTKILANDGIDKSGQVLLEKAGFQVITEKVAQDQLANAINENNYEVVLVRSATTVRKEVMDACPNLKMIGRGGVGMDNIDVAYGREKGIDVFNTPGASSQSVAELVFSHLFSMARFLYDANRNMPVKGETEFDKLKKNYAKGIELRGKTIGIIGFGRIGQSVATYALGCGMKVIAHDPFVKDAHVELEIHGHGKVKVNIKSSSMDELLANADFISLHVPKQKDGSAVIKSAEIEKMKAGVCLVNTARGGVINEDDLIAGLNSGKIAHAALDVFENEPTPRKDLLSHPKISLTPHIGASTVEAQDRIGVEIAEKIISFYKK
ncbi:MAG TPA: 3-phosphoglycerate dehydrogenase [Flavobacteriales bacterium]|nr:3-phosphoglycerate dehydrogenase [Flavobacteriales bacterium]HCA82817.1 3-phosphoglycerate dehydrogenase [Flavobacteriales bacterium]HRE98114.1 D-2-hydroxyacid dehydrogenase [Flavobacteriales bacterium]HRJ35184.1 D-2-hydroxyacid dehydrogenase [Flavobacteriales bacterium]HRJ39095.1 D-2-hydroxyacid dehydrogenase [Flavobacteriales bacterium]